MSKGNAHIVQKAILKIRLRDQREAYAQQSAFQDMFMSLALPVIERVMDRFAGADEVIMIDSLTIDLGRLDMDNLHSEIPERVAKALGEALHRSIHGGGEDQNATWKSAASQDWEIFVDFLERGTLPWTQSPVDFVPDDYVQKLMASNPEWIKSALPGWLANPQIAARLSLQLQPATLRTIVALFSQTLPQYFSIFQRALRQIVNAAASPFPRSSAQIDAFVATVLLKLATNSPPAIANPGIKPDLPPLNATTKAYIAFLLHFLPDSAVATHATGFSESDFLDALETIVVSAAEVSSTPWEQMDAYLEAGIWTPAPEILLDAPAFGAATADDLLENLLKQEPGALQRYLSNLAKDEKRLGAFLRLVRPSILIQLLDQFQPSWRQLAPQLLRTVEVAAALFPQFPSAQEAQKSMLNVLVFLRFCQGLDAPSGPTIEGWLPILIEFLPRYHALIDPSSAAISVSAFDLRQHPPRLEALLAFIIALDFGQRPELIAQLKAAFQAAQAASEWRTYFLQVLLEAIAIMLSGRWSVQWVSGLSHWFQRASPNQDSPIWDQWQAIFKQEMRAPSPVYEQDLLAPMKKQLDPQPEPKENEAPAPFQDLPADALRALMQGDLEPQLDAVDLISPALPPRNPLMDAPPFPFAEPTQNPQKIQPKRSQLPIGDSKSGLYVDNAGIVLLNPFFQPCFQELGWMNGYAFGDDASQENALMMLAFLATGEEDVQEARLPLLKLLVGMDLDRPVRMQVELSDRAKEEADTLLVAANAHWEKAGKLSPDQFRAAFLNREGRLKSTESGWNLKVDRQTIDILLEFLPWGFGTIKLPWMQRILSVDW